MRPVSVILRLNVWQIIVAFDFIVRTGYSEQVNQAIAGLKKQRIDKSGNVQNDVKNQALGDAVAKGEGCRLVGQIKLHKVPSTIFITTE